MGTPFGDWLRTVGIAITVQWAVVAALTLLAGLLGGWPGAVSLMGGGAAVAVPNALLAVWLGLRVRRFGVLSPVAMLLGEILKLGLTVALLVMVIAAGRAGLSWLWLLVGVIAALKAQWLAVWFTRNA